MITPEELYKRHTEAFPNDKCVTMFGYKAEQILFALRQTYSKDKSKMTREFEERPTTVVKFKTDNYPDGLSVFVDDKLQFASKRKK